MVVSKRRVPRLFLERDLAGDTLSLDEREAHYLANVLRLQRGDEVVAFNGRGIERNASIGGLQKRGAHLELRTAIPALPDSTFDLTLLQALPKADAMDLIVQKATELGARAIVPVYAEFSVVKLDAERSERRVEHWRRIAQSACEQCGRHAPPRIVGPDAFPGAIAALPAETRRFALDPEADAHFDAIDPAPASAVVAIGPEGGFGSIDWRRLDAAQFERVRLGPRVLRAETAAIAVCAVAQARWGDL